MTVHQQIIDRLQVLNPSHIDLINESMNHSGYFEGKESHFKLIIVSTAFEGKRLVARHQQVYSLVNELMIPQGGSIHALAIHAYTPEQWQELQANTSEQTSTTLSSTRSDGVPNSPNCAGQNKS